MKEFCLKCMKEQQIVIRKEIEEVKVKEDTFEIELQTPYCAICNEDIFVKEIERENDCLVYDQYRRRNHLLTTKQMKDIRDSLGLTQKAFAKILGFGAKTITRYENGSIQDIAHDNLMRLYSKKNNVGMIFDIRKDMLSKKDSETLQFALGEKVDLTFEYKVIKSPFSLNHYESVDESPIEGENYEC